MLLIGGRVIMKSPVISPLSYLNMLSLYAKSATAHDLMEEYIM